MISSAEAALLISKFESESRLLRILIGTRDKSIYLRLTGRVVGGFEGQNLKLEIGNGDFCVMALRGCTFEYGDERQAPQFLREDAARMYEGTLGIWFPSDLHLSLTVLREQSASDA
jgi:hypothetical protein